LRVALSYFLLLLLLASLATPVSALRMRAHVADGKVRVFYFSSLVAEATEAIFGNESNISINYTGTERELANLTNAFGRALMLMGYNATNLRTSMALSIEEGTKLVLNVSCSATLEAYSVKNKVLANWRKLLVIDEAFVHLDEPLRFGNECISEVPVNRFPLSLLMALRDELEERNATVVFNGKDVSLDDLYYLAGKYVMLNYTTFEPPLEKWTRAYDSKADVTRFFLAANDYIDVLVLYEGQRVVLRVDPVGEILVKGNVRGSGDYIVFPELGPAKTALNPLEVLACLAAALLLYKSLSRRRIGVASATSS